MKGIIFKASLVTIALLWQTTNVIAAPTWMPEYIPEKVVYVDPAMFNHDIAPYVFSSELSERLSGESEEGLKYFVVAAQQGDEPVPSNIPLGIAKVDELLPTWTNQPEFPKENYVVIFWVRKSDDLNKGSVGVNVGKIPRQAGVTTNLLSAPKGLVIPALKENMPADPEEAMLDIVANIENQLEKYQEAEIREREAIVARKIAQAERAEQARIAAIQRQERIEKFNFQVMIWLERLLHSLPMIGGAAGFGFIVFHRRRKKVEAQTLIERWKELVDNSSTFYYEIEKNELPKIELLPSNSDFRLKAEYDSLIKLLARFMALSDAANQAVKRATSLFESGNFKEAVATLTTATINVETAPYDVSSAELDEDISQLSLITASDLKKRLTANWQKIKDLLKELLSIQGFYLKMSEVNAFSLLEERCQELLDSNKTELNYYGLGKGAFDDKSDGIDNLVKEYKDAILKSEIEFKSSRIYESRKFFTKAENQIARLKNKIRQEIEKKRGCETWYQQVFSINELSRLINISIKSLIKCKRYFPNENLRDVEQTIDKAIVFKEKVSVRDKPQFIEAYQNKNFSKAYSLLENIEKRKEALILKLKNVAKYPEKLQSKKALLIKKYREIQSENQALKSRYQIHLDTMLWEQQNLDTLSRKVNTLESSLKDAQQEERRATRSSNSSLSSSYGSYSSGSDYGSYSGGGDYGSSSGGGDY